MTSNSNRASAPRCMVLAFLLAVIAPAAPAFADDLPWPRLPCAGDPSPPCPEVYAPARAHAWVGTFEETAWRPPACAGWESRPFKVLVALTGRFHHAADASTLLARFGAISGLRQVLYWSITDRAWLHLTTEADALERPDDQRPRAGFTSDELIARPVSYFRQKDNRLKTTTVYGIQVRQFADDRMVVAVENVSAMRFFGMTVVEPGGLQSLYFLHRQTERVWRFYSVTRTSKSSGLLLTASESSYVNRAVAMYRFIAGIPTDQGPPAPAAPLNR